MSKPLLLVRPQPGNDRSAAAARALGLDVVQIPLFEIVPVVPDAVPEGPFDALLVTSINGATHGAALLRQYADLPVFVVGEASAQAARDHGAVEVHVGGGDAASTLPRIAAAGHRVVLHLSGEETRPFDPGPVMIVRHIVYRSEAREARHFTKALSTLPPAIIAVHSPAAGRRLNALMPLGLRNHMVAAISEAAAQAVGQGWRAVRVSPTPDDSGLLHLARTLCMGAL